MREYNKPTLEVNKYTIAKVNICTQSVVQTEKMDWEIGVDNGVKNALKK